MIIDLARTYLQPVKSRQQLLCRKISLTRKHLHGPANQPPAALLDNLLPTLPCPPLSAVDSQDYTCKALPGRPLASNVQLLRQEVTDGGAPWRLEASGMDRGHVSLVASLVLALELVDPAEVGRGYQLTLALQLRRHVCRLRLDEFPRYHEGSGRRWAGQRRRRRRVRTEDVWRELHPPVLDASLRPCATDMVTAVVHSRMAREAAEEYWETTDNRRSSKHGDTENTTEHYSGTLYGGILP